MIIQGSQYLTTILHALSQSLMLPVIAGLLGMLVYMVAEAGAFLAERQGRRQRPNFQLTDRVMDFDGQPTWQINSIQKLIEDTPLEPVQKNRLFSFMEKRELDMETKRILAREIMDRQEADFQRRLDRTELLSKIGPVLGLMGTLIPLGPGLGDLGQGNVQGLSQAMIIAFDTTVIGVAVGAAASVVSKARRRWYMQDIGMMEMMLELIGGQEKDEAEQEKKPATGHQ